MVDSARAGRSNSSMLPFELQVKIMSTITSIKVFETPAWGGIEVVTPRQTVTLQISNYQYQCEYYGAERIDVQQFLGAQVLGVQWGKDRTQEYLHAAVLEVMTCRGILELVLFNEQYGYPHTVEASWNGSCHCRSL